MGSKEEWQKYQEALRRDDKVAAAEAFRRYQEAKRQEGKGGSDPRLVSLGLGQGYPHNVPLDQIPEEVERNPEFFELMKRIAGKEK